MNTSPQYWRARKHWSSWLGRKGTVIASTRIHTSSSEFSESTPYPYVIVDFGDERCAFMGVGHEELVPGETVECVWRRLQATEDHAIISYGIKVQRFTEREKPRELDQVHTQSIAEHVQESEKAPENVPLYR